MNKEEKTASLGRILYKSSFLIAYCISIGACSELGTGRMIITSVIASLFLMITPEMNAFPMLINFLCLFVLNTSGIEGVFLTLFISILTLVFVRKSKTISETVNKDYIKAALGISTALTMTVLITTLYFGIGATGNTVITMIKSYRSLGFHPNWRGILYGTIVMVVMITFPRKFKKASKIISPEFIALIITLLLNYWLIPKGSVEVIKLLNPISFSNIMLEKFETINPVNITVILLSGFAIGLTTLMADSDINKVPLRSIAIYNIPACYSGFIIPGQIRITKSNFIEGIISSVIILAITLPFKGFERLPLSSCAVVLIVSAWHNVKWGLIPKSFKNYKTAIAFIITIAVTLLITPAAGVIAAFVSSIIINDYTKDNT